MCVCVGNMLCKSEVAQRGVWACLLLGQGMFLECRPWNSTPGVKIFICNPTLNCYPETRTHTHHWYSADYRWIIASANQAFIHTLRWLEGICCKQELFNWSYPLMEFYQINQLQVLSCKWWFQSLLWTKKNMKNVGVFLIYWWRSPHKGFMLLYLKNMILRPEGFRVMTKQYCLEIHFPSSLLWLNLSEIIWKWQILLLTCRQLT